MSFKAKKFPRVLVVVTVLIPLSRATYPARLVQVMVLGTQAQRPFQGQEKAPCQEIALTYECLDEFLKDDDGDDIEDKPRWITETIPFHNLEADKAKSTKRYYALDANAEADGDWSKLIGTPCMITVVVTEGQGKNAGKKYENISNVSAMRPKEAAKAPPLVNEPKLFDFYEPDMDVWVTLPKWLQDKMKAAVDFGGSALEEAIEGLEDEPEKKEEPKKKAAAKKPVKAKEDEDDLEDDEIPW